MTESSEASSESRGGDSGDRGGESLITNSSIVAVPVIEVPFFVVTPGTMETSSPSGVGFKEQIDMKHQSKVEQKVENTHPLSDPIKQTTSSLLQYLNSNEDIVSPKPLQLSTSDKKPQSTHLIVKTTSSDGYNWRKYGQKQVKSSEHSRSYFRCTQANCFAKKKVEHYQDGHVIEIIYHGQHNHELPQKTNFLKGRVTHCSLPERGKKNTHIPRLEYNGLNICKMKPENECCNEAPEQMHQSSICERDHHDIHTEGDFTNEPDPKRRFCENSPNSSAPLMKTVKEPKVVVQASFDSGIVNDGYRWRKYGQKIVKGNPNPRSYYKCTNIGCPVRKHVEKALEDIKFVIITYEGKHNHDLPPCKNGNETPTPKLIVAPYDEPLMEVSSPLLLQNKGGEILAENRQDEGCGKMVLESAETLLSIGSKSSSGDNGKNKISNSDVIQSPMLDRSCSAVSVQNS